MTHTEQPMPVPNQRPSIQSLVRHDLEQREQIGISRYGTPLQPHNGRDALRDLYEELLDGACYARQAMEERQTGAEPAAPKLATSGIVRPVDLVDRTAPKLATACICITYASSDPETPDVDVDEDCPQHGRVARLQQIEHQWTQLLARLCRLVDYNPDEPFGPDPVAEIERRLAGGDSWIQADLGTGGENITCATCRKPGRDA